MGNELLQAAVPQLSSDQGGVMRAYFDEPDTIYGLVRGVFCAAAITCFLYASHRIARGIILTGQVAAFDSLEDAYTPEEREALIHKIKQSSLRF
jgi:hypothetical protein